jgi:hypothetical protein
MPLGRDFLAELGLLSANFQALEKILEFFIWGLLGQDTEVGQTITAQLNFRRICALLSNLFRLRTQDCDMIERLSRSNFYNRGAASATISRTQP